MAAKVTFDPTTTPYKTIFVTQAPTTDPITGDPVIELDVKVDLYSDGKEDWLTDANLRKFNFPIRPVGGQALPGSRALGSTFFLSDDWKIAPYEASHVLRVNGNIYRDDGGTLFLNTVGTYTVRVEQQLSSLVDSTLQQLAEIEYASFNGGVTVDLVNGTAGTTYPAGSPRQPVNNLADAVIIAQNRGFDTFFIRGNATIDGGGDYSGMIFIGESKSKSLLTVSGAANVTRAEFYDAEITGVLDGNALVKDCVISNLTYVSGFVENCVLNPGTIVLGGGSDAHFLDCWSGVPGVSTPTIDCGGSGQSLAIRNYNGGIRIINKTGAADSISVDLASGQVILDSTVTAGTIIIRGQGKLTDNSTGSNVDTRHLITGDKFTNIQFAIESLRERGGAFGEVFYVDPINGSDTNPGTDPDRALATITYALTRCTNYNSDMIFLVARGAAEVTITEDVEVNVADVAIRGPGEFMHLRGANINAPSITISAAGVSLEGFSVHTQPGGVADGVQITAPDVTLRHLNIHNCTNRGIFATGAHSLHVDNVRLEYNASHGLEVTDSHWAQLVNSILDDNDGDGVKLNATVADATHDFFINNTLLQESGGYGINIGTNVAQTMIMGGVTFFLSVTGDIQDNGINTYVAPSIRTVEKILRNRTETDPATGKFTVYDDDNTTVLLQGDLFEDIAGTQLYRGQGADRRERLT